MSIIDDTLDAISQAYEDTAGKLNPTARTILSGGFDPEIAVGVASKIAPKAAEAAGKALTEPQAKTDPKKDPKKKDPKDTTKLPSPEQASESPFTQLTQALATQYLQQEQQLAGLTSGAQTPGLEAEAQGGAQEALKGVLAQYGSALPSSVTNAVTGFLGNAPAAPLSGQVAQSQEQLGNAQSAGALGMAGAIGQLGPAEAQTLAVAPYQQILNELASETAYRASSPSYGSSAFGATTANTPAWLQSIFKSVGLPVSPPTGAAAAPTVPGSTSKAATGGNSASVPSDSSNPAAP